jgi:hypothetical protein
MLGDTIIQFFSSLGIVGLMVALYLIFLIDSMIFPALPDFFLLIIFATDPQNVVWGLTLLIIAVSASFSGNTLLYVIVKRFSPPRRLQRAMKKYSEMLIISDERILLVNRIAPVLPYTGAFIVINNWSYRKAMKYIVGGACIKFGVLLLLSGSFFQLFQEGTAQRATFILILVTIGISLIASFIEKKRLRKKNEQGSMP